ncbi:MAG: hypothetical protein K2G38_05350 [Clostridia bacterium]|nr:hypothetical protein [Clostridia bacterium]
MKVCNSEAMKLIKELEERKKQVIYTEDNRSRVSYKEGEEMKPTKYDYAATRKEIAEIDERIRKIKHALAKANCTVKVDDFNITIGEALVYLAQLNAEYSRLETLSSYDKLARRITANGVLEYTECLYDPETAEKDQKETYSKICKLQIAIDRANLNNFIEV